MAAKGMSQTLYIIIAAVVILVSALVILTIFAGSFTPVVTISQAQAQCQAAGDASCGLTNQVPPTWKSDIFKINGEPKSCDDICSSTCPIVCSTTT